MVKNITTLSSPTDGPENARSRACGDEHFRLLRWISTSKCACEKKPALTLTSALNAKQLGLAPVRKCRSACYTHANADI